MPNLCVTDIPQFVREAFMENMNFKHKTGKILIFTSKEVVVRKDHTRFVPKLDRASLMLPRSVPTHLILKKVISQPCYIHPARYVCACKDTKYRSQARVRQVKVK